MYHMKEGIPLSRLSDLATQNLWLERVSWRQFRTPWKPRMGYVSGVSDLGDASLRYLCRRQGRLGRRSAVVLAYWRGLRQLGRVVVNLSSWCGTES
jgi:hypothetical protein